PGDIEALAERALVSRGDIRSDVLVLPHHGSRTSSTESFLSAVSPALAVVSVGEGNAFGHPHPEVLERVGRIVPDPLLRTDQNGTVTFSTDGERLWVRAARP